MPHNAAVPLEVSSPRPSTPFVSPPPSPPQTCGGAGSQVTPCSGSSGPSLDACLAAGCCYNQTSATCWAVQPFGPAPPAAACSAAGSERQDCGFSGIGRDECVTVRGCCWDSSTQPDGPQCFFNATVSGAVTASFPIAPAPADACFDVTDVYGYARGRTCAAAGVVTLALTDGPAYLQ